MNSDINTLIKSNSTLTLRLSTPINNIKGRYWINLRTMLFGVTDIRARVGTFSNPWSTESSDTYRVPPLIYINDKLKDIVDARAVELNHYAKKTNKRILIQWSGGIDSTLVLSAFIKNISATDLLNVSVILTLNSIIENYDFYCTQITGKISCINWLDIEITDDVLRNNIILHGDPADCLFGPSISMYQSLMHDNTHLAPFKDNINLVAKTIDRSKLDVVNKYQIRGFGKWYTEKITDNLLEIAPDNITSIADWWWWHYFNFKWQFSLSRPFLRRRTNGNEDVGLSPALVTEFLETAFFNTDRFQQWSYSNLPYLVGNDIKNHKQEAKQYIYELDKNQKYLSCKTKVESMPVYDHGLVLNLRRPIMWDQQWKGYHTNYPDLLQTCVEHLEKYKG